MLRIAGVGKTVCDSAGKSFGEFQNGKEMKRDWSLLMPAICNWRLVGVHASIPQAKDPEHQEPKEHGSDVDGLAWKQIEIEP